MAIRAPCSAWPVKSPPSPTGNWRKSHSRGWGGAILAADPVTTRGGDRSPVRRHPREEFERILIHGRPNAAKIPMTGGTRGDWGGIDRPAAASLGPAEPVEKTKKYPFTKARGRTSVPRIEAKGVLFSGWRFLPPGPDAATDVPPGRARAGRCSSRRFRRQATDPGPGQGARLTSAELGCGIAGPV